MPAQDLEKLVVQLSADIKKYENAMRRAQGIANQQLGKIEKRAQQSGVAIGASFAKLGAALVTGATLSAAKELIDTSARIQNALKVAGLEGDNLTAVYNQLFQAAQRNAAPVESLVSLYGRLSLVQKELGVDQQALISFTSNVATALRAGGTSAAEASGALLQLSQALGGGVVRAEEFNSVLEGAPTIARAAAAGLKEAGGSVAQLRNLVIEGKVSSQAFFAAFQAGSVTLDQQVSTSTLTLGQRVQQLRNELVDVAGKMDQATGASQLLGTAMDELTNTVKATGAAFVSIADSDIGYFIGRVAEATGQVRDLLKFMGGITGTLGKLGTLQSDVLTGKPIGSTMSDAANTAAEQRIQQRIDDAFDQRLGRVPQAPALPAQSAKKVVPVSIEDFSAPSGAGSTGKKSKGGGRDSFASEIEQIKERTAAIQAETAAQAGINPLIDDYGFAIERARSEQDFLTAAQKQGVEITPQLREMIGQLSTAYAQASVEAQKLAESQDAARAAADDFRNTGKDIASGFISDLRNSTSAADALRNALDKVADKLIGISLNAAFGIGGSGGGGGGILSLLGWAKGGYTGNGGKYQPAGIVHKGEYVFDKATTKRIGPQNLAKLAGYANGGYVGSAPRLPSMPSRSSAGSGTFAPVYNIDARGADSAAIARLERGLAERDRTEAKRIAGYNQKSQTRKTRP